MFPEILTEARSLVLERINSLISAESKVSNSMLYTSTAESKTVSYTHLTLPTNREV